jgi:hypothetical protein
MTCATGTEQLLLEFESVIETLPQLPNHQMINNFKRLNSKRPDDKLIIFSTGA